MNCDDLTYSIDELKREIFSSNPVFNRLEDCLPDVVPGQEAVGALLSGWNNERKCSECMITYNGLKTLVNSVFWFANSNAFQQHQAINIEKDSTFQEILAKENFTEMDNVIIYLTRSSMCDDALTTIIWFFREFLNTCKANRQDFEKVLKQIIQESLLIIYKIFYVLACEKIS